MNIPKIVLMPFVFIFFAGVSSQGAGNSLDASANRILKKYVQYLDLSARETDIKKALMTDFAESDKVRKELLGLGDEGLKAMESLGLYYGNRGIRYDSRYAKYWRTYACAAIVDAPGVGRPRVVELCKRSDVSVQIKVWILEAFALHHQSAKHWFPEDVLMNILDELLKVKTTVACNEGAAPSNIVLKKKASDGSEDVSVVRDDGKFRIYMSGDSFAVEIIRELFKPSKISRHNQGYTNTTETAQARKESIEYATKWVASRRVISNLKETLFRVCEQHTVVEIGSEREQYSLKFLASLIDRDNTSDIGRLLKLYLREVGATESLMSYKEMLGEAITGFFSESGLVCSSPSSPQLTDFVKARDWVLHLIKDRENSASDYFTAREWSLLHKELSVMRNSSSVNPQ